jgi:hypothetical protein
MSQIFMMSGVTTKHENAGQTAGSAALARLTGEAGGLKVAKLSLAGYWVPKYNLGTRKNRQEHSQRNKTRATWRERIGQRGGRVVYG